MTYKAEYIWIDGTEPTAKLRSKTKVLTGKPVSKPGDLPIWGFDGSSTNQARPMGVPGRAARSARRVRPAVDRPVAAVPHGRGLRRLRDARPQAGDRRLERRRRAHQLLDEGHARGLRPDHHGVRGAGGQAA